MKVTKKDIGKECEVDNRDTGWCKELQYVGKALIIDRYNDAGCPIVKVITKKYNTIECVVEDIQSVGKRLF